MEERSSQACVSCRKQKRKCDKALPACALCARIGRQCDYEDPTPTTSRGQEVDDLRRKVDQLEDLLGQQTTSAFGTNLKVDPASSSQQLTGDEWDLNRGDVPDFIHQSGNSNGFNNLFFLDSPIFEYEQTKIQKPHVQVPGPVLQALGPATALQDLIHLHFEGAHIWLPIVSKTRLLQQLSFPLAEPAADFALLLLSMKLLAASQAPDAFPDHGAALDSLYKTVKSLYQYAESNNAFSVQLLQALIHITVYEIGQGLYPTAFLTSGHCTRLGLALGIHDKNSPQMLPKPSTWTEQEERRRIWWAILILDRYVSVGLRGHPFASRDISLDSVLPVDDAAWTRGETNPSHTLALSASKQINAGPFARTCQASHLLGRVIEHVNDIRMPAAFRYEEAFSLDQALRALCSALPTNELHCGEQWAYSLVSSIAICYSGLLILYDNYSCPDRVPEGASEDHLMIHSTSIEGLQTVSAQVLDLARSVRTGLLTRTISSVSPFMLDALYQAASTNAWNVRERNDAMSQQDVTELKEVLRILEPRWKVAGDYANLVEATELQFNTAVC